MFLHHIIQDDGYRHAMLTRTFRDVCIVPSKSEPGASMSRLGLQAGRKTVNPPENGERREKGYLENVRLGLQCGSDGLVVCKLLAELVDELPDSQ